MFFLFVVFRIWGKRESLPPICKGPKRTVPLCYGYMAMSEANILLVIILLISLI